MTRDAKRTPDSAFDDLPGFEFKPNYVADLPGYEDLRVHYVDEGPGDASDVVLCLHGQPTWSYLYRKMIPIFAAAGLRVVAPDLLGFGRSDKPVDDGVYTYSFHRNMLIAFIERLDLRKITLVCQDWGGLLGLPIVPDMADRFSRLLVMNTAIATGKSAGKGFEDWKAFNRSQPDLDIAGLMKRAADGLSDAEAAAYAAPFPDVTYKAGVRRFPELVMTEPDMDGVDVSRHAWTWYRDAWQGESFMAIGMQDPVLGPKGMHILRDQIRNCPEPLELSQAGHFVQEHGEIVAKSALEAWSLA